MKWGRAKEHLNLADLTRTEGRIGCENISEFLWLFFATGGFFMPLNQIPGTEQDHQSSFQGKGREANWDVAGLEASASQFTCGSRASNSHTCRYTPALRCWGSKINADWPQTAQRISVKTNQEWAWGKGRRGSAWNWALSCMWDVTAWRGEGQTVL